MRWKVGQYCRSLLRGAFTCGAAACGIISSCISTFHRLSCRIDEANQRRVGVSALAGLSRAADKCVDIVAPHAPVTRADLNIYHDCALSCKVLQQFRYTCDVDLHQYTRSLMLELPEKLDWFFLNSQLHSTHKVILLDLETLLTVSLLATLLVPLFSAGLLFLYGGGVNWLLGTTLLPAHSSLHSPVRYDLPCLWDSVKTAISGIPLRVVFSLARYYYYFKWPRQMPPHPHHLPISCFTVNWWKYFCCRSDSVGLQLEPRVLYGTVQTRTAI